MLLSILSLYIFSACSFDNEKSEVDKLNNMSYAYHYQSLDSTFYYANKALSLSKGYSAGRAEAYNNLAFFHISKMNYGKAYRLLDSVDYITDNQVELLIADIQRMRLCQRESNNKKFYDFRERAQTRLKRINEEKKYLSERLSSRLNYAKSEFLIVSSTYFYYLGFTHKAKREVLKIDSLTDIHKDTVQYINYLYQLGSGGLLEGKTQHEVAQKEFEYLFRCYIYSKNGNYKYWEANSLQAISEHLMNKEQRTLLISNNKLAMNYLNVDYMPDSLLAGNLAQRALSLFVSYGDVYQIAGAYRTLAVCYWTLGDFKSSLICLENALADTLINQAPDLVASICEQMSLAYSAVDDKNNSDIYRNKYLDLQEETRQDRQLEARVEQLEKTSTQLNILIIFIIFLICIIIALFFILNNLRKKRDKNLYIGDLLKPLKEWNKQNYKYFYELNEKYEEIDEQLRLCRLYIEKAKKRNLDNRSKVFLVNNVIPYIDRIINEIRRIGMSVEADEIKERYDYVKELISRINDYNDVLTHWIQLQQGQLSLHIESFKLQEIFNVLLKSTASFQLKGIKFEVKHSDAIIKADKIMTLFMLNTISDNSRKFTKAGGSVVISAEERSEYVEISVSDTGEGIDKQKLESLFDHKIKNGHGFGLMNCKGIIDKYRKTSHIFSVCGIFAESEKGKGCRIYFRLPHGIIRVLLFLLSITNLSMNLSAENVKDTQKKSILGIKSKYLIKASNYADSAYYSNIKGTYQKTLNYADSSILYLNLFYKETYNSRKDYMYIKSTDTCVPAEIIWFRKKLRTDYDVILDIRNECAVASLALHKWDMYLYNNKIYTQLFKEMSADNGLAEYCLKMQRSKTNKIIAVIFLILLLFSVAGLYYFLYYRHVLYYRFCIEKINNINKLLLSNETILNKLSIVSDVDLAEYPKSLKDVIIQIKNALEYSVNLSNRKNSDIEYLTDALNLAKYEKEKLYVSNNVIDNCLSALKHETMYYPSQIRLLIDNAGKNIQPLIEVALYYKELYSILCEQIQRQVDTISYECKPIPLKEIIGIDEYALGDFILIKYLFEILRTKCGCNDKDISISSKNNRYIVLDVICHKLPIDLEKSNIDLFIPTVQNIPYLICRQIVRENSELTNRHGCGIVANFSEKTKKVILRITLARYIYSNIS